MAGKKRLEGLPGGVLSETVRRRSMRWLLEQKNSLLAVLVLAVLAATILAYLPALEAGFYFDDKGNILDATSLHWTELSWVGLKRAIAHGAMPARPVANLSIALNHLLWGKQPKGYHLVNIFIHLACGLALVWVSSLLAREGKDEAEEPNRTRVAALSAAALFLLHPLNIQAVTYVVQRMTSLATLFSLLSFGCYLAARRATLAGRRRGLFLASFVCWLLALGSKEIALALPAVLVAYEACFRREYWRQRFEKWRGPSRALVGGAGLLGIVLIGYLLLEVYDVGERLRWNGVFPGREFTGFQRVLTQARVQLLYLSLLVWPVPSRLNLDHDFIVSTSLFTPWTTPLAILFWLGVAVSAVLLARARPRYGFPVLAYLVLHAIESAPIDLELVFEHRMYLPMDGLVFLLTNFLVDMKRSQRYRPWIAIGLVAVALGCATYMRNRVWRDRVTLWTDVVNKSPKKPRGYNNLGSAYFDKGRYEKAIEVLRTAVELDPKYPEAHHGLAEAYAALGRTEEATKYFAKARDLSPHSAQVLLGLGNYYAAQNRFEEAIEHYRLVLALNPRQAGVHYSLGLMYSRIQDLAAAERHLLKEKALNPTFDETYRLLGTIYEIRGLRERAIQAYDKAAGLNPGNALAHYYLGSLLGPLGRIDAAISHLETAVKLTPLHSEAHNNLGSAYLVKGWVEKALDRFQTAVKLNPGNAKAHYNLAVVYRRLGRLEKAKYHQERARSLFREHLKPSPEK